MNSITKKYAIRRLSLAVAPSSRINHGWISPEDDAITAFIRHKLSISPRDYDREIMNTPFPETEESIKRRDQQLRRIYEVQR